ncbi:MAG: sigma-70 family RNA polymerase sigma factor [Opitutae bacterium]|nr:sigma-70 family RNA polymerase sigma factor [Opitutae bacterium]
MGEITLILGRVREGDAAAANELMARVYDELRRLAAAKLARERAGHTLQATALVHEAWLRLGGDDQPAWQNRRHFLAAAAEAMRRILIDRARQRQAARRGAGAERVSLDEFELPQALPDDRLVALSEALDRLAAEAPEKAELVKLRYFAGLTLEQVAEAQGISHAMAKRWWTFARVWLLREMQDAAPGAEQTRASLPGT